MSNLERGAIALDEARQKRQGMMLPKVDFEAFMKAREEDKANVKSASDYQTEVIDYFFKDEQLQGAKLPWEKTFENFRLRQGEVSLWSGINGHGKSQLVGQVINSIVQQNIKVCVASFEMHPYSTLQRMTRQATGAAKPTEDFIVKYFNFLDGKLWMYDQQGTVNGDRVIAVLYYAVETLGIQHFVIDSLMKCGVRSDDMNAQKEFLDKLCAAARDLNVHVHLIAHSRKGEDEFSPPNKMDVAGSADITNQVDNVMTVWRNKKKEKIVRSGKAKDEDLNAPDCLLICDKQRHGEWEGEIALWFDAPSMRYKSSPNERVWQINLT
jgi:twinkle protein